MIETGRSVREVAVELSVLENSLSKWVRDERRRLEAVAGTREEPLTPPERAEPIPTRRQVAEQGKDLAFLGKAAAYFVSKAPSAKVLR